MSNEKILLALNLIEAELDDATNQLPDYNANSDALVSIDCARNELYCLKDDIERAILDENQKVTLDEVMNTSPTLAKGL
jgi:hypothetical protein